MGRLIKTEADGKDRARLIKAIAIAVRLFGDHEELNDKSRDISAFIALALDKVSNTIDPTVRAWEKKGYWVKADRFRMEWSWTGRLGYQLKMAVISDDWLEITKIVAQIKERVNSISIPTTHRLGEPWTGAWKELISRS